MATTRHPTTASLPGLLVLLTVLSWALPAVGVLLVGFGTWGVLDTGAGWLPLFFLASGVLMILAGIRPVLASRRIWREHGVLELDATGAWVASRHGRRQLLTWQQTATVGVAERNGAEVLIATLIDPTEFDEDRHTRLEGHDAVVIARLDSHRDPEALRTAAREHAGERWSEAPLNGPSSSSPPDH